MKPDDLNALRQRLLDTRHDLMERIAQQRGGALGRVEAALVRIREGTYGQCKGCGEPMDLARLQASPEADRCVSCQTHLEQLHPH